MWVFNVSEVLKEPIVTEMGSHGCVFIATNNSNVDPCVAGKIVSVITVSRQHSSSTKGIHE